MAKSPSRAMVYAPGHPRADTQGKVPRAWIVMEKMIARPVTKGEIVHHENEDPRDDAPSNLRLFPNVEAHSSYHSKLVSFRQGPDGRKARARLAWSRMSPERRANRELSCAQRLKRYA